MTREQAVEIWQDMYIDEVIAEYNHYVNEELYDSDLGIWEMECLGDLIENVPPMNIVKLVVYGDVRLTDDYVAVNKGEFIKTISKNDVIDYVIENIDDDYLIDIAKEYEEDEEDE